VEARSSLATVSTLRTFVSAKVICFDQFLSLAIAIGEVCKKKKRIARSGERERERQPRGKKPPSIEFREGEIQCTLIFKVRGRL